MIELSQVTKLFKGAKAVDDLSLTIKEGSFCVLPGPSGCGKSRSGFAISIFLAQQSL